MCGGMQFVGVGKVMWEFWNNRCWIQLCECYYVDMHDKFLCKVCECICYPFVYAEVKCSGVSSYMKMKVVGNCLK